MVITVNQVQFSLTPLTQKTMGKSDALSWRSDHGSGMEDNRDLTLLTPGLFAIRALEGLQVVGEEKDILKEIRCGMDVEDQEEVVVKAVKELKKSPARSVRIYSEGQNCFQVFASATNDFITQEPIILCI